MALPTTAGADIRHKADAGSVLAQAADTSLIRYDRQEVSLKNFVKLHTTATDVPTCTAGPLQL